MAEETEELIAGLTLCLQTMMFSEEKFACDFSEKRMAPTNIGLKFCTEL